MKKFNFLSLVFAGLLVFSSFSAVKAQNEMPPDAPNKQSERQLRPNLLAELDLSPPQRQQIRRVNAEKRPLIRDAKQRLQEAKSSLDRAIYADTVNETEFQIRLKDVQTAQAELNRIFFTYEFAVRRILSAEQLGKFKDLREQFSPTAGNNIDRPLRNPMQNLKQRFRNRRGQARPNN